MTTSLESLAELANKVLRDPKLMRKLSDRVYTLLQTEVRLHRDQADPATRR